MAAFFNKLGSQTYNGGAGKDSFFLFTFSNNLDNLRVDGVASSLVWTTAIVNPDSSFFQVTASNIAFSTDLAIGGNGVDIIYGSNGNDAVFYNNGVIAGGFGGFTGIESFDLAGGDDLIDLTAQGAGGVDYAQNTNIDGGLGNDTILGGAGRDSIVGRAGNDVIFGYRGADTVNAGDGDDLVYGDDLGFNGIAGDDSLRGDNGNDTLFGGERIDQLFGGANNDVLYGGFGGDGLFGEDGDDVLYGDDPGQSGGDNLDGGAGADTIFGVGGNDEIVGGAGGDIIDGGDGLDFIEGGTGADRLIGGAENDTIDGDADIDTAVFSGARADYLVTFNADGSLTIADQRAGAPDGVDSVRQVEFFEFADGTFAASELSAPPVITSDGGGDTAALSIEENTTAVTTVVAVDPDVGQTPTYRIAGGADAALFTIDSLTGALSFIVAPDFEVPTDAGADNVYDVIVEASDGHNVDTQAIAVTVTDVNEAGVVVNGTSGADSISPTATNAALRTTALNDTVFGLGGNDTIDGGQGVDSLEGGAGNDLYFVDAFLDDGVAINDDRVTEGAGGGLDTVEASVSYRLADNVEILNLVGLAISGFGNALSNGINGNDAANALSGDDGNDTIAGGLGADTLNGDAGSDRLDGGEGADVMNGGDGSDTYFVDVYSDDGNDLNDDLVVEAAGAGTDLVNASVSYRLTTDVENLTLTGSNAIDGFGNLLANAINGNTGANALSGGLANDTLRGNSGSDTLSGEDGNDQLFGDTGADTLLGGLGVDRLEGGAESDYLDGGATGDTILGQAGDDTIVGGVGRDTMTGGTEADVFVFNVGDTGLNATSPDIITDFATGVDRIDLSSVAGPLAPAAYAETAIATDVFADALAAANAQLGPGLSVVFVAGSVKGFLFWDSNGDGTLDQTAFLNGLTQLSAFDSGDVI
jgi:Ca2+-binding RTX toxin-like protein